MTDHPTRAVRAGSFDSAADLYERGRPPYPPAALDWLLPPGARRVLDLGAGTGKLTRQLVARGLDVVAVEPLAGMRAELARVVPGPGAGRLGERIRSRTGPWTRCWPRRPGTGWTRRGRCRKWPGCCPRAARWAWSGTSGTNGSPGWPSWAGSSARPARSDGEDNTSDHPRVGPPFSPLERHDVPWVHQVTLPELLDMVASRSYAILLPAQERQVLLDRVRQLAQTHPAVAGQPGISLPYVTQCWRSPGLRC